MPGVRADSDRDGRAGRRPGGACEARTGSVPRVRRVKLEAAVDAGGLGYRAVRERESMAEAATARRAQEVSKLAEKANVGRDEVSRVLEAMRDGFELVEKTPRVRPKPPVYTGSMLERLEWAIERHREAIVKLEAVLGAERVRAGVK